MASGWWSLVLVAILAGACAVPRGAPIDRRNTCTETGGVWLASGTCYYDTD
jgi:hypothetical protein